MLVPLYQYVFVDIQLAWVHVQFSQCWVTLKVFCWHKISLGSFVSVSVQFLSLFRTEPSKTGTASRTTIPNMHVGLHRSPFENKYPHIITKVGLQVFLVYLVCIFGLASSFPDKFYEHAMCSGCCPSPLLVSFGRYYLQSRGNLPTA